MSHPETHTSNHQTGPQVLTLAETAAFLRVTEEAVRELIENDVLPAQQIGGEWRFLKQALVEWLGLGSQYRRDLGRLETKSSPAEPTAPQGSKEAVLPHFCIFHNTDRELD